MTTRHRHHRRPRRCHRRSCLRAVPAAASPSFLPLCCSHRRVTVIIGVGVIAVGVARRAEVALRRFLRALRKWRCGGSCAPCRGGVAVALARCKGWWWRRTCVWRWVGGGGDGLVCCKVEAEAATGT
ncbi:hypothetical protein EDB84DRAFT_1439555 [Lactarius hengduanensis]|nr:hypothetical protein EDB84DRAFT_1439555 [Lactarius hengduanensis]